MSALGYLWDSRKVGGNMQPNKKSAYKIGMAVDNLPCELPRDSSKDFGDQLIKHLIPFIADNNHFILKNSMICKNGVLTDNFSYLKDFVSTAWVFLLFQ